MIQIWGLRVAFWASLIAALVPGLPVNAQTAPGGTVVKGVAQYLGTLNSSAVITTGNTFQTILASIIGTQNVRQSLTIQNNNLTSACQSGNTCDLCWVFIGNGTPTIGNSIVLAAGQALTRYFPYVPPDQIRGTCATASDTLYVDTE